MRFLSMRFHALVDDSVTAYIDNGGTITKCPTPPNYWSESRMKLDKAGRARHEKQVESFLRGGQLITPAEISKLNAEAA
jgi:hypothetical protein